MERKINDELLKWKRDYDIKPLVIYGPHLVGKSYSTLSFGRENYKNIAYYNTENNQELEEAILKENDLERLIKKLSLINGTNIFQKDTLIILDNVSNRELIKKLKIFTVQQKYDVIIITNIQKGLMQLFGEKFYYKQMTTLDFEEYLIANGEKELIEYIKESYSSKKAMPFHNRALELYYDYLKTGGYPECIHEQLNNNDDINLDLIKQKILKVLTSDTLTSEEINKTKINEIINILPYQLLKPNKKFQYGLIKKGGRSKEYQESINYLISQNILNRCYRLDKVEVPLNNNKLVDSFKLYFSDVGLLYTKAHINQTKFSFNDSIKNTLIENNIANTLVSNGNQIYYYQSDGKSEISFVVQNRIGKIIPIEIQDMTLTKAKSLSIFMNKYNIEEAIKITTDNFSKKKNITIIPVYAVFCLGKI